MGRPMPDMGRVGPDMGHALLEPRYPDTALLLHARYRPGRAVLGGRDTGVLGGTGVGGGTEIGTQVYVAKGEQERLQHAGTALRYPPTHTLYPPSATLLRTPPFRLRCVTLP
eukprot:695782-Rhodomonas_salina.1